MNVNELIKQCREAPQNVEFEQVIAIIDRTMITLPVNSATDQLMSGRK